MQEDCSLEELVNKCKNLSDNQWDNYQLKQDKFYHHYTIEQKEVIVRSAEELSRKKVREIREQMIHFNDSKELTGHFGIRVKEVKNNEFAIPNQINFGQYQNKEILISTEVLELIEQHYVILKKILGEFSAYNILLYHEIFHYLEEMDPSIENTGLKVPIYPLPFIKRIISPSSAGEIAAFLFAKELSGIQFNPLIIEIVVLFLKAPKDINKILNYLSK